MTNSAPRGPATILGTNNTYEASVGDTLTAKTGSVRDADGIDRSTAVIEWHVQGQYYSTGTTYVVQYSDLGKQVSYRYAYTDNKGNPHAVWSVQPVMILDDNMRRVRLVYELAFGIGYEPDLAGWLFWTDFYERCLVKGMDTAEAGETLIAEFRAGGLYSKTMEALK